MPSTIDWPDRYHPDRTPVHARNEIVVAAPPERLWAWLVRAPLWPMWYPNSKNVRILTGDEPTLRKGTEFSWHTFGVGIRSTVLEFQPPARMSAAIFPARMHKFHQVWLEELGRKAQAGLPPG